MSKFVIQLVAVTVLLGWISAVDLLKTSEAAYPSSPSSSLDKLCRQVYTDCQACSVFESECRKPSRPSRPPPPQRPRPTPSPTLSPSYPPPPQQSPAPTWPPQQPSQPQTPATWPPQQPTQAPWPPQQPTQGTWPPQQNPYPDSPQTAPPPTQPPTLPPHNCVQYGKWCKSDKECCTKNCQLELVTLGDPDHHYTQSVCR